MKERVVMVFAGVAILFSYVSAQDDIPPFTRSYAVKMAPAGINVGKIALGGEFNYKRRNSVTLMIGIPFTKNTHIEYDGEKSRIRSRTFSLMGGYRYYLGKRSMAGAYLEPYLKYVNYRGEGLINGTIDTRDAAFDTRADYSGFGFGAQLGVQFFIAKRIVIDFYFFGPEANTTRFSATSVDIADNLPWDPADAHQAESDIKDIVRDIPIIGKNIFVDVDQAGKTVYTSYSGFLPSIRFGASIGFRF